MGYHGILQERVQLLARGTAADYQEGQRGRCDANGGQVRGQTQDAQGVVAG